MCHKARYSWVVLAASFVAHYLLYGVTYGLGVFYVIIMETFQAGPTEVSLEKGNAAIIQKKNSERQFTAFSMSAFGSLRSLLCNTVSSDLNERSIHNMSLQVYVNDK